MIIMALYVFLKKGDALNKERVHQPQNAGQYEWSLKGQTIFDAESVPYMTLDKPLSVIQQFGFTKDIFFKATLRITQSPMVNPRQYGVYVFGKARAELRSGKNHEYLLEVESSSHEGFNDMETIQEMIWSGQIAPVLSYTSAQKKQSLFEMLKYVLSKRKLSFVQRFLLCWKVTRA